VSPIPYYSVVFTLNSHLNLSRSLGACQMGFQTPSESNFVSYNLSCEKIRNVRKIKMKKTTLTTKHMEPPRGFSTFPPLEIQKLMH
jgi:hypothetical protein